MKKCINCGADNEENASFCAECGQRFCENNLNEIVSDEKENSHQKPETADEKSNRRTVKIICAVALCVFVLFTVFNIFVCTDVINGKEGSAIEKYESSIESLLKKNKNQDKEDETTTKPKTEEDTDISIWDPDNDPTSETKETEPKGSGEIYLTKVGKSNLFLRKETSTDSEILDKIPDNTELTIYRIEGGWGYTKYNNKTGWVNMKYVEQKNADNANEDTTNIIKTKMKTQDVFTYEYDEDLIDRMNQKEKKINVCGKNTIINKTTASEMKSLGILDDFDVNQPVNGLSGGSYEINVYYQDIAVYADIIYPENAKTIGEGIFIGVQSWEQEITIVAANKNIILSKTTLQDLLNDGWKFEQCYIEQDTLGTEYNGFALISNNETFVVGFSTPINDVLYSNSVIHSIS